ncbi:MAG: hypothetical protein IPK20_13640 [Betaproteobacteria bacterium]|nr:hypothetical protein [Betaproteobacteria bacterium]
MSDFWLHLSQVRQLPSYTVNLEGIQAKTGRVETNMASVKLDPKYREATEKLQDLDLLQARTCHQLRSMRPSAEKDRLESLYVEMLIEMQRITLDPSLVNTLQSKNEQHRDEDLSTLGKKECSSQKVPRKIEDRKTQVVPIQPDHLALS